MNRSPRPKSRWPSARWIFRLYVGVALPGVLFIWPPYGTPRTILEYILTCGGLLLGWLPIASVIVMGFEQGLALVSQWEGSRARALGILTLLNALGMTNALRLALLLGPLGIPISSSVNLFVQVLIVSLKWVGGFLWIFVDPFIPALGGQAAKSERVWAMIAFWGVSLAIIYSDLRGLLLAAR